MDEKILEQLKKLYPDIENENQDYIKTLIEIATVIATNDGLADDKLVLGIALLVLDILFPSHSESGVKSRSIDGVSESYGTSYITSRWKRLYDMLINGTYDSSISIYYDGVE